MRILATAAVAALCASSSFAQFATNGANRGPPAKALASRAPPPPGGGFLMGADDCNTPHTNAGTGVEFDVPFTTGTTGAEGQTESLCYAFGMTGIANDVWFDWTTALPGAATLTACAGTGVDTKIAIWPDNAPSSCPTAGSSIACNDDACGLQSSVTWLVSGNTTYTIQLGTFPGAAGGSGTFDITIGAPPLCGQYDDGSTENALGLTAGGEIMWLHSFHCGVVIDEMSTAYGTLMFPGSVTNGNASRLAVYDETDCDNDPTTGLVFLDSLNVVIVNGDTDQLNPFAFGPVSAPSGCTFIGATADQVAGEFPGPMDQTNPVPEAWVAGSTLGPGTMDIVDLNNNNVPPLQLQAIGFPSSWLLRANFDDVPGTPYCFGAETPMTCPCGNIPAPGAGCGNGTFPDGALLFGSGTTQPDTVVLHAQRATPNQPGLFFQGDNAVNGGLGIPFGDGLRCAGTNAVRLEIVPADANGNADTSVVLSVEGGVSHGETKHYQYWYRDPALSPCGQRFNLTNGYTIPW